MVAVISNYFSVHEHGEKNWSKHNVRFWWHGTGQKLIPSHKTCVVSSCCRTCVELIFPTLFWFLCKTETQSYIIINTIAHYSINDDVTLRFFWFKFTIFYRTRNDNNATWCACRVFVWNLYCCFFCPVLVVTWCACRDFLFLFCSFLVNFTNLSWKQFNIILIYWVERYYYLRFFFFLIHVFCFAFVWFLGWGH